MGTWTNRRRALGMGAAGVLLAAALAANLGGPAAAQPGTGTIVGRVVWCPVGVVYPPYPVPLAPDAQGVEGEMAPEAVQAPDDAVAPDGSVVPGVVRRPPTRLVPAGAVLVAVQGTARSTRTDENGRFTLTTVPAGQYLTVAAGPVASGGNASAHRVNAMVNAGQRLDVGVLYLQGPGAVGCGVVGIYPGVAEADAVDGEGEAAPEP